MNWLLHWDEELEDRIEFLDTLEGTVQFTSKNLEDFKIPTEDEIDALFATNDESVAYKSYPSISTNEYKVAGRNLDLVIDNVENAICSANVKISNVSGRKCPHCGESYYMEKYSMATALYCPPIYKNGVNINPNRNKSTTYCTCMNCGKEFSYED